MPFDPVELLSELVSIPSVNPMGRRDQSPASGESRLTDHLEHLLAGLGLHAWRQTVALGRENLIARLDGHEPPERGGGLLLLDAHQDTVPVEGMTIDPWSPVVREGRLYGRGACDTKGGMAAMIAAVARLAAERPPGMPSVLLAFTVDEEYHLAGAPRWRRSGASRLPLCRCPTPRWWPSRPVWTWSSPTRALFAGAAMHTAAPHTARDPAWATMPFLRWPTR